MDENNPPMVLPNGNVYSLKAINEMTETKGSFADPRSMEEFSFCQAKKAYVAWSTAYHFHSQTLNKAISVYTMSFSVCNHMLTSPSWRIECHAWNEIGRMTWL